MTDATTKTRLKRIIELKDQIETFSERIKTCKSEINDILPHIQTSMQTNDIDEFNPVGQYKIIRREQAKQPALSKQFIQNRIDEYLVSHGVNVIGGTDLVQYIYDKRKQLSEVSEKVNIQKLRRTGAKRETDASTNIRVQKRQKSSVTPALDYINNNPNPDSNSTVFVASTL